MGAISTSVILALIGVSAWGTRPLNAAFVTSGGRVVNGSRSGDGVGTAAAGTPGEGAFAGPSGANAHGGINGCTAGCQPCG